MAQLHAYLPGMLLAYAAYVLATISPGPALLATIGTSMSVGRKSGFMVALGIVAGSFVWAMLTAAGLSAVLAQYAGALNLLKIGGGLYLLWLAYKSFRSAASAGHRLSPESNPVRRGPLGYFLQGWAVQMTNPKSILAWIAIISLGLRQDAPAWISLVIVAATSVTGVIYYGACAFAFSTDRIVRLYGRARRWIDGVLGVFFAFAGVRLLTSRT